MAIRNETYFTIFTNTNPIETGYKKASQDDFSYYNSHCDPPVLAIRALLERWFQQYPYGWKKDLARRFRDKRPSQFNGAFWELYLHALFIGLGFQVEIHPKIGAVGTRPDMMLLKDGIPYAVVEARLAGSPTDQEVASSRLEAELLDPLNTVHSPNFFLLVREIRVGRNRPSFRALKTKLERWLLRLDPHTAGLAQTSEHFDDPSLNGRRSTGT